MVSVLYAVFKPVNKYVGALLDTFSSPVNTYNYLNPLVKKRGKEYNDIGNDDFLNGAKIHLPVSEEEQQKIVEFLATLEQKISNVSLNFSILNSTKKHYYNK